MGKTWGWLRRHWLDVLLPPTLFLLVAAVTRHVLWVRQGQRYAESGKHYQAAAQAGQKGDRDKALKELFAAAQAAPDDASVHHELASAFHNLNQPVRAAEQQEIALHLSPPKEAGYIQLISTLCDLGRFPDADRVLRADVLPRWPNSAEAAYYEGLIHFYRDKGDQGVQQAIACFERCLRLNPKHANARYQHGVCLSKTGRPAEAEQAFREVLKVNPVHDATYQGLANALRQQSKVAEAQQVVEKFQRLDIAKRRINYLTTQAALKQATVQDLYELGGLFLTLHRPDKAQEALAEYVRREPTDTRGLRRLAEAYRLLQRPLDAASAEKLANALEARREAAP